MDGTWLIVKWVWVAVCFVWLAVQAVALRRLKGDLKRRSMNVFWVVFVLMMVSDWIRDVFEIPKATRIGMLTVGVAAIVATILLVVMLRSPDATKNTDGPDVDVEGHIQSLKLG
jgi:hypothetical protein